MAMRPPIRWPGGKTTKASIYLNLMPPHKIYGEPFGGGASLLFAKTPVQLEIYNDTNKGLVSLFRVLRDPIKFKQFYDMVQLTPYSRLEFQACRDWYNESDELTQAWKFYVMARQCFGGIVTSSGWSYDVKADTNRKLSRSVGQWLAAINNLPMICERLRTVQIESLDYLKFFELYDNPEAVFYIDPPYYGIENIYDSPFCEESHEALVMAVSKLKAKCILSNYQNDLYDILLDYGWRLVTYDTKSSYAINSKHRIEAIYINYQPPSCL